MSEFDLAELKDSIERESQFIHDINTAIRTVIIGQDDLIEKLLLAILTDGHVFLEGVPGLAKTLTINSLAKIIDTKFQRLQFTPDLLPADILGTLIYNPRDGSFEVKKGPIFANIILADEINRSPAKVQSALLEAMQERQITIGDQTFKLENPFLVMATQNPIEQEGTYPLPEAQLDRFMFNILIDYPSRKDEVSIVQTTTGVTDTSLNKVISREEILEYQSLVRRVPVAENVIEYAVDLVSATRPGENSKDFINEWIDWGAGPRASQYLILGAKTRAVLDSRPTAEIDDVKALALPVLRHRVLPNFNAEAEGMKVNDILKKLIEE